ncbi:MAG: FtsH protease activity modulator HflK [Proteobacteria bacterium]|nr:FtsH protease activity modulator HflK [Pseudomonadota bacterium]
MAWDWEKLREQQQKNKKGRERGPEGDGGGGGGGGMPPQFDDLLNQLKKFKLPGGFLLIILLAVFFFGQSMVYTIDEGEVGVIQIFGKYSRTTGPGLHFKLPAGIEKLSKVNMENVRKVEFGAQTEISSVSTRYSSKSEESRQMLTGDLNVALVPWLVHYRISDPYLFLFKVYDPERLLKDLSEASMQLVVGDRSINEVILKREEIAIEAMAILQKELDVAETGVTIKTIEMQKTNVPERVQPSFNMVNKAEQEKERMILKAQEDYNTIIPAAKGEAEKTIKSAEGYALERVNKAEGDAARFSSVYIEYVKAKDITRRRLYLEAIKDLFPKLGDKIIVDENQKNFLPMLQLQKQNSQNGATQ